MPRHTIKLHRFSLREKSHPFSSLPFTFIRVIFVCASRRGKGEKGRLAFSLIRERFSNRSRHFSIRPFFVPLTWKKRKLLEIVIATLACYRPPYLAHCYLLLPREGGGGGGIKFPLKRVKSLANQRFRFRAKFMHGNLLDSWRHDAPLLTTSLIFLSRGILLGERASY